MIGLKVTAMLDGRSQINGFCQGMKLFSVVYPNQKKVDYELWGVFQWLSLIGLGSATNGTSLPSLYVFLLNFLVGGPTIVNNLLQKQI